MYVATLLLYFTLTFYCAFPNKASVLTAFCNLSTKTRTFLRPRTYYTYETQISPIIIFPIKKISYYQKNERIINKSSVTGIEIKEAANKFAKDYPLDIT